MPADERYEKTSKSEFTIGFHFFYFWLDKKVARVKPVMYTAISIKVAPVIHDAWCMVHVSYHAAH